MTQSNKHIFFFFYVVIICDRLFVYVKAVERLFEKVIIHVSSLGYQLAFEDLRCILRFDIVDV